MDSELAAILNRIEQRQAVYERVAHELVSAIGVQTEMLTAVLKAATVDPGPSPVAEALQQIALGMRETNALLTQLPTMLATVIREEMTVDLDDDDMEPAEGAFEREQAER
ncbi:MAG: hypothetical protein ACRYG8_18485 [Janthinobacterium lividum]